MKKVTKNKDGSVRKSGSGRPSGSISIIDVDFADLAKRFKVGDKVKIGRVFWEEVIGAKLVVVHSAPKASEPKTEAPEVPKVEEKVDLSTVAVLVND